MKAQSAITLLRSIRNRMEVFGPVQMGAHDVYALFIAHKIVPENKSIQMLLAAANLAISEVMKLKTAGQSKAVSGFVVVNQVGYDALRTGYKAIEALNNPTKEFLVNENDWKEFANLAKETMAEHKDTGSEPIAKIPIDDEFTDPELFDQMMKAISKDPAEEN